MAKKKFPEDKLLEQEYLDLENDFKPKPPSVKEKVAEKFSGATRQVLIGLKFVIGLSLLPFVFSGTGAFLSEFARIESASQRYFWAGVVTFLVAYLFIWEPGFLYTRGQKVLAALFSFFTPLVKVAPSVVPIYTLIVCGLYGIFSLGIKEAWLLDYCMVLSGFFMALHLVFSAKSVRSKKGDFLKSNYIFSFSFIYLINLILFSSCLNLIFQDYSLLHFLNTTYQGAHSVLWAVFKQLFIRA